ncbi:type II toxin-antitoxin system PemK/MazF family toxin [Inquilinus sp. CAU 1745]|uniref:type II toxin-antitoxin system PemK/MazF family toxin n=1 Tax=Inquilinus sp. CAU 1745 TaxID=3140369 RepID=UPI00325A8AC3
MPDFEQGDIVRVPFPYTDRETRQHRPALVVSKGPLGDRATLLWVAMITSAENRSWSDDVPFGDRYPEAGLPAPSVVRASKIATIETRRADPIGKAPASLLADVMARIGHSLGI